MAGTSHFPFTAYLRTLLSIHPDKPIAIEPLTGGLTNYTVRAQFTDPGPILFPGTLSAVRHNSVIVKHAPPYIASLGPEHALSTRRQLIEAHALSSFSDPHASATDLNLVGLLHRHPNIHVPKLLHHDEEKNVLIMSDLGRMPTLLEYLTHHPDPSSGSRAATILGEFLADLYRSTSNVSDASLSKFKNKDSSDVVLDLVAPLPRRLLKAAGVPDADALGEMIEQGMAGEKQEHCFGMVDLWPGSILIGDNFVGLVDWEYAGRSSAGSELGMLSAHLCIPLLSPTISADYAAAITRFTTAFLSAYTSHSPTRTPDFIQSALLAHGRELINAIEFQSSELAGDPHKDALIQAGARCLRAAKCGDTRGRGDLLMEEERVILAGLI